MKPRRVRVTLEVTTSTTMVNLRDIAEWWNAIEKQFFDDDIVVHKVQVNVVKPAVKR